MAAITVRRRASVEPVFMAILAICHAVYAFQAEAGLVMPELLWRPEFCVMTILAERAELIEVRIGVASGATGA